MQSKTAAVRNHSRGWQRLLRISDTQLKSAESKFYGAISQNFFFWAITLQKRLLWFPKTPRRYLKKPKQTSKMIKYTFQSFPIQQRDPAADSTLVLASTYSYCSVPLGSSPVHHPLTQLDLSSAAQGFLPQQHSQKAQHLLPSPWSRQDSLYLLPSCGLKLKDSYLLRHNPSLSFPDTTPP